MLGHKGELTPNAVPLVLQTRGGGGGGIKDPVVGTAWLGFHPPLGTFRRDAPELSQVQFTIMAKLGIKSFAHTPGASGLILM